MLTLVAQATLTGVLVPAREMLASVWLIDGGSSRDLLYLTGYDSGTAALISMIALIGSTLILFRLGGQLSQIIAAVGVGIAVAGG